MVDTRLPSMDTEDPPKSNRKPRLSRNDIYPVMSRPYQTARTGDMKLTSGK